MATKNIRAFISYSHKDKQLAAEVKECLADFGIEAFLAHDDIRPSASWVTVIQAELRGSDVFLPLLTNNYPRSDWTDQETGIALGRGTLTLPLSVDIMPYGFLASIQAVRLQPERPRRACRSVVDAIIEQLPAERGRFLDGFIPKFAESGSYDDAGYYASILVACEGYSTEQIQSVLRGIIENRQIYESYSAQDDLKQFIKRYGKADPALAKKALRMMAR